MLTQATSSLEICVLRSLSKLDVPGNDTKSVSGTTFMIKIVISGKEKFEIVLSIRIRWSLGLAVIEGTLRGDTGMKIAFQKTTWQKQLVFVDF